MKRICGVLLLLGTVFLLACNARQSINDLSSSLNGRWEFRKSGDTFWLEATVPGTVQTDLYKNVLIDDPFFQTNEKEYQWIDKEDWEYRKQFIPDNKLFQKDHVVLRFEGLDTYADVSLNGQTILQADNMFRSWETDITKLLRKGETNEIRILFHSPIRYLKSIFDTVDYHLPAVNDQAKEKLSVYARKAPYQFGWDWGPRFVNSGIWKSVYLEAWDDIRIDQVFYRQTSLDEKEANLHFSCKVTAETPGKANIEIRSTDNEPVLLASKTIMLNTGENYLDLEFIIPNPERWWPNGLGTPHLYTLTAIITKGSKSTQYTNRIGLRNIELIREPDDFGESFYFKVNGIPVFMKGANYIPQDNFLNHVMSTEYDHLIQSVKDANMNMLRVWGGGIYEMDYFYDLCDENGILVWQDFMFACSMYPGNPAFLESVRNEAIDNVVRLRNHPCIALWCGNNEVQDAWHQWGWQFQYTDEQKDEISENYENLFHKLLPDVIKEWDPDRPYWPSSPASGLDYGQTSNTQSGDLHYWGVWHGRKPFESYQEIIPRFSSEYGFQSFPELKTIESFTLPADRQLDSPVMQAHQRHPIGNQLILNYMDRYYPVPDDFADFIYMSQVMQGEGIRFGIEALRRSKPQCMGSLYWQLNDCWPVASWSGIDYYGRWKALHYQAREAYAPLLISISESADSVFVHLVSDELVNRMGILSMELMDFDGKVYYQSEINYQSEALKSIIGWSEAKTKLKGLKGAGARTLFKASFKTTEENVYVAKHYFVRSKFQELTNPGLSWTLHDEDQGAFIRLVTQKLARQVYLIYSGEEEIRFEHNFFDLLPGESRRIKIHKRDLDKFDLSEFRILVINNFRNSENL